MSHNSNKDVKFYPDYRVIHFFKWSSLHGVTERFDSLTLNIPFHSFIYVCVRVCIFFLYIYSLNSPFKEFSREYFYFLNFKSNHENKIQLDYIVRRVGRWKEGIRYWRNMVPLLKTTPNSSDLVIDCTSQMSNDEAQKMVYVHRNVTKGLMKNDYLQSNRKKLDFFVSCPQVVAGAWLSC